MTQDSRLIGKLEENDGSLPVMKYDFTDLPQTSENIWHAQKAGWPTVRPSPSRVRPPVAPADPLQDAYDRWTQVFTSGTETSRKRTSISPPPPTPRSLSTCRP